jgi:hypothetical protein
MRRVNGPWIDRIERFIFESPRWRLVLVLYLVALVRTGVWYMPNLADQAAIAADPFVNPLVDPEAHYVFSNWLGPFLAWLVGARTVGGFFALHLAAALALPLLFARLVFQRLPEEQARASLLLFFALPVSTTALYWVGMDGVTLLLMLAAVAYPRLAVLTGLALGMQHFEQGLFAAAALVLAAAWARRPVRPFLLLLLGLALGRGALALVFRQSGIVLHSDRVDYWMTHGPVFVAQALTSLHVSLWSVLGVGWFAAVKNRERAFFWALIPLLLLLPLVGDQTRVVAIVTFPLVAVFWLLDDVFLTGLSRRWATQLALAWVAIPWIWIWGGRSHTSVFTHDVAMFGARVLHLFDLAPGPPWTAF